MKSKFTSPLITLAPTKASASTSRPEWWIVVFLISQKIASLRWWARIANTLSIMTGSNLPAFQSTTHWKEMIHTLAVPEVYGNQVVATQRCQNALKMEEQSSDTKFYDKDNVVDITSEKIIIHPGYARNVNDRTNFDNDIALIRFATRVNLGPNLLPICLPEGNEDLVENEQGTVSGFGVKEGGRDSAKLRYASIGVFSTKECQNTPLFSPNNPMIFTDNMFCAGADGRDSCEKDSGGPFVLPMLTGGSGPFRLGGIVSWGSPCRERRFKGYYTKVKNYVQWIKNTIDATEKSLKQMGWTSCIIWFLYVSVSECWPLPDSEPVMYGEVQSPQYPQPYPPNLLKQWDLSVPEGYQIGLTFTHLDIEASAGCYYDALTVLYNDKVLGKFCGHENSADGHHPGYQPILSPGNRLTLVLQTDDNNPERHQNVGFSAQYQAIDIDECSGPVPGDGSGPLCSQICLNTLGSYLCSCHHGYELRSDQRTCVLSCHGGIFDELEGHLSSPGYPHPAPHAVSCQYVISVELGFTVSLNFTDKFQIESMDTQQGPSCLYHWLEVTIPNSQPVKLCGGESPGLITTNSNIVRLDYHTDNEGQSSGWSLDYSTHRVKCPFPGTITKGRVTPVLSEYFYRDYIFVRCDQGYKLMMDDQEIESFSAMCQNNGQWHLPLPECRIIDCGEPEPLLNGGVTFLSGFQNQYRSVVQYHCNEPFYSLLGGINVSFTCEADRRWRSNHDVVVSPTCIPVCGQPTKLISAYQRIIGGSEAPVDTIPWQVLLNIDGRRGGGMVIGDRWVMTAAHNLIYNGEKASNETVRIFMGTNEVKEYDSTPPVYADSIHMHPQYNNPSKLQPPDINGPFEHERFLLKQHISSHRDKLVPDMRWTYCIIWFLYASVCECWRLHCSEPVIHGEVRSPQYPQPYPPNLLKQWDLWVPEGHQIQLSLTHLDIKVSAGCYQDSLTVLYHQRVLGKFCGQENSTDYPGKEPIISPGNILTLIFQTSDSTQQRQQHTGFSATYKAI
eukprot:superscaffoldBa00002117_g13247